MAAQITPGSVVVGLDGSDTSGWALQWGLQEADRRGLPLVLVHTDEQHPAQEDAASDDSGGGTDEADPVLQQALDTVRQSAPGVQVSAHHVQGHAAAVLVEASATAVTVVLGAGSRGGVSKAVLGSVSHQVATHGHCPVVVVRAMPSDDGAGAGQVVLALDDSEACTPAIEYAFAAASRQGLGLTAVHAWWREYLGGVMAYSPWEGDWSEVAEELEQMMEQTLAGWCAKYPDVPVHRHLVRGHAVKMLVQESEGAALLVVGSRGRGGFPGLLLGSVSTGLLQHADCPVAVVHQPASEGA
jgi:nucleotide-binding universal stress UspA family protein